MPTVCSVQSAFFARGGRLRKTVCGDRRGTGALLVVGCVHLSDNSATAAQELPMPHRYLHGWARYWKSQVESTPMTSEAELCELLVNTDVEHMLRCLADITVDDVVSAILITPTSPWRAAPELTDATPRASRTSLCGRGPDGDLVREARCRQDRTWKPEQRIAGAGACPTWRPGPSCCRLRGSGNWRAIRDKLLAGEDWIPAPQFRGRSRAIDTVFDQTAAFIHGDLEEAIRAAVHGEVVPLGEPARAGANSALAQHPGPTAKDNCG